MRITAFILVNRFGANELVRVHGDIDGSGKATVIQAIDSAERPIVLTREGQTSAIASLEETWQSIISNLAH